MTLICISRFPLIQSQNSLSKIMCIDQLLDSAAHNWWKQTINVSIISVVVDDVWFCWGVGVLRVSFNSWNSFGLFFCCFFTQPEINHKCLFVFCLNYSHNEQMECLHLMNLVVWIVRLVCVCVCMGWLNDDCDLIMECIFRLVVIRLDSETPLLTFRKILLTLFTLNAHFKPLYLRNTKWICGWLMEQLSRNLKSTTLKTLSYPTTNYTQHKHETNHQSSIINNTAQLFNFDIGWMKLISMKDELWTKWWIMNELILFERIQNGREQSNKIECTVAISHF